MAHDVVSFGEALLRLQPTDHACLEDAPRFHAYVGGAELNTSCALASLGLHVAWFSVVPEGPVGRRVLQRLRAAGVDASLVRAAPGRLGAYWCEYGQPPRSIEVIYDRSDSTVCHKVLAAEVVKASGVPGTAIDDNLTIACGQGALRLTLLQKAGKKAMTSQDFLRGQKIPPGTGFAGPMKP